MIKYYDFTLPDIVKAIRHQWKLLFGSIAGFLIIGVIAGFLFSDQASAENSGSVQFYEEIAMEDEKSAITYYADWQEMLTTKKQELYSYLDAVQWDSTITQVQMEQLTELLTELDDYTENVLAPIMKTMDVPGSFFIPDTLHTEAIWEYQNLVVGTEQNLQKAEYAAQLIESMNGINTTNETINDIYASLLSQAANYQQCKQDLKFYQYRLDLLQNHADLLQKDSANMEVMLSTATDQLNGLREECNALLDEISRENHLNLSYDWNQEVFQVTIDHTNRLATKEEAFSALVLFCGLTGICVGVFFALYQECKRKGKFHQESERDQE